MPASVFEIRLLGSFNLVHNGDVVPEHQLGSRTARELLKLLATEYNQVVPDDRILESLWPGKDPERVRRSLWVRISELRRLFSTSDIDAARIIVREAGGYCLKLVPGIVAVDIDRFVRAADAALATDNANRAIDLGKEAIALYRGEFLAGSPYNDHWHQYRKRLGDVYRQVAERTATLLEESGALGQAIDVWESILSATDPQEAHYRALMRLYYMSGRQTDALRIFEECRSVLDGMFGVRPMPETIRLLETIVQQKPLTDMPAASPSVVAKTSSPGDVAQTPGTLPFLGRMKEVALLRKHLDQLHAGKGSVVWIDGESGVGKSRLVREACRFKEMHRLVPRQLDLRGHRLANTLPFSSILDALQELSDQSAARETLLQPGKAIVSSFFDWARATEGGEGNYGAFDPMTLQGTWLRQEILDLINLMANERPLLIVADNADTIDDSSLDVLLALSRRVHTMPILIVIVSQVRMDKHDFGRAMLESTSHARRISVTPLVPNDLLPLLGDGPLTATSHALVSYLYEKSDGNAFTLNELILWMEHSGLIVRRSDGTIDVRVRHAASPELAQPPRLTVSQSIRDKMDVRISHLSKTARTLLLQAAVLGEFLSLDRLQRLSRLENEAFFAPFEELLAEGFLTEEACDRWEDLRFSHARLHNHIYYQATSSYRRWLHQQALGLIEDEIESLATDDESASRTRSRLVIEAAFHARLAKDYETACRWFLVAAKGVATRVGSVQSVALYRQAYEVAHRLESHHPYMREARGGLGQSLYDAYMFEEAIPLLEAELATGDLDAFDAFQLTSQLALSYMQFNRIEDARRLVDQLFASIDMFEDPGLRGNAYLISSFVTYRLGETHTAIHQAELAIPLLAQITSDDVRVLLAYRWLSLYCWDVSEYGVAILHAHRAVSLARKLDNNFELIRALNQLGEIYQDLFCVESAERIHNEALELAVEAEHSLLCSEIRRNLGMNYLYQGHMDKALRTLESSWRHMQDLGVSPYWQEIGLRALIEANLLRGDAARVADLLKDYGKVAGPREAAFLTIFKAALALLNEDWNEFEANFARTEHFWQTTERQARLHHVLLFMGRAFVAAGESDSGRKAYAKALNMLEEVAAQLPDNLAAELDSSRPLKAARATLESLDSLSSHSASPRRAQ